MSWVLRVRRKLTLESMVLMSWVLKVSIALRLIAVVVTAHVLSDESKAKINIGVNGIHVMSVESFRKKITATCQFSFDHVLRRGKKSHKKVIQNWSCTIKDRQFQTAHPVFVVTPLINIWFWIWLNHWNFLCFLYAYYMLWVLNKT